MSNSTTLGVEALLGTDAAPKIMGLPPRFLEYVDKGGATWQSVLNPMPIITITPCVPMMKQLEEADDALGKMVIDAWNADETIKVDADQQVVDQVQSMYDNINASSQYDKRSFILSPAGTEYFNSFNTLVARMGAHLKINSITNGKISSSNYGGLHYYAGAGTSFSESGSNDYVDSVFSSVTKSASSMGSQFKHALEQFGMNNISVDQARQAQTAALKSLGTDSMGKIQTVLNGGQVLFPKIWEDSSFTRSYNLEFVFETPYGDRESIFRHVYVPFASLLAMILPRQTGLSTYTGPFLCKVDCKGLFTIDTGAITSFSIDKSKEHQTAYGATRKITVTLTIEDLYPALMNSPSYATLAGNFGLCQYIDNLALVSNMESGDKMSLSSKIRQSVYKSAMGVSTDIDSSFINIMTSLKENDPFKGTTLNSINPF